MLAKHLARLTPGNPSVVVRNMPGAEGLIASNHVYNIAKPDGQTLYATSAGPAPQQWFGIGDVKYDVGKMPAIAASSDAFLIIANPKILAGGTAKDIVKAKGIKHGTSRAFGVSLAYLFGMALLDVPVERNIWGMSGGDRLAGILSGEINVGYETASGFSVVRSYIKGGELVPLFQTGVMDTKGNLVRHPLLPPEVPTVMELYEQIYGKPASGKGWDAYKMLVSSLIGCAKVVLLPPGVPQNVLDILRESTRRMTEDTQANKEIMDLVGVPLIVGNDAQKLWDSAGKLDKDVVQLIKDEMKKKYNIAPE